MKFVESLPEDGRRKNPPLDVEALRQNAGQWAEVDRRPREQRSGCLSRGQYLRRLHPEIEFTTRTLGDEIALFARAVSA